MAEKTGLSTTPLSYLVERLGTAQISLEPYPHFYLEQVFPDDYYQEMLRHLPASMVYQNLFEVTTLKLDHFRHRDQRDLNPGWTKSLPEELRNFWDQFDAWFLGDELARAILQSFAEPLRTRFGEASLWPQVSVEAQLI